MNITSQLRIKFDKFQVVEIILILLQNVNYIDVLQPSHDRMKKSIYLL